MDEDSDIVETGISPNTVNNTKELSYSVSLSEEVTVDPLLNPQVEIPAVAGAVINDDDECGTAQEWLAAVKREVPIKDEGDEDDEDVGTSSFENLSPLSDDTHGSTKGFRKVLGICKQL